MAANDVGLSLVDSNGNENRRQALLKAGALQTAILTSANFAIIATDEKGIIQLFNLGAERMLGYRAAEVVDRINPSDIHDPAEVLARAAALSEELGTTITPGFEALAFKASRGIEDVYELTYICKDGSRFPALVSITALRGDFGDIIGYLLIGTDNSARKTAERELHLVVAAAEKANLAKSDFLSGMSHELRTPLNAILGFAQLIETSAPEPTPGQRRSLDQILKAGWYLLQLINEILDLALIESGKLSISLEPTSLAEVLHECHTMIEPQAIERGIRLSFPMFAQPSVIRADRMRIKQIMLNLLSNAIKYNRPGGHVIVKCTPSPNGYTRISVEDSGSGLSADQLAHLFEPFNRLGRDSHTEAGTGIGLVMSKRLTELLDGTIGANSSLGVGSEFWVELKTEHATMHLASSEGGALNAGPPDTAARSLLYVEDNPANLLLVENLLARRENVRLYSVKDGLEGVAMARTLRPDVILMDINLPGLSGLGALQLLANDPLTAHIPVIALSANAGLRDIDKALTAGFYCYLTKPIKVPQFMETLDRAFESSGRTLVVNENCT